jgi:predicted nucleic acid-binding protein
VQVVVPDASVILKWVLPSGEEPQADNALLLRTAIHDQVVRAIVPGLWLYEVGNTVARRFPTHAEEWLSALAAFGFEEAPVSQRWLRQSLELTRRCGASFYDATYHATAIVHDGVFVTSDERYVQQAATFGALLHLRDWLPPSNATGPGRR